MKKNILHILLLLFLSFLSITVMAQSWNRKYSLVINYSSLNPQNRLTSVFNLLAANNNKNVNNIRLQLNLGMHFSLSKSNNGQVILSYSGYGQQITGSVFFRDFKVDSVLLPGKLAVKLLVYNKSGVTDTLDRVISITKGRLVLPLTKDITLPDLSVKIIIGHLVFTANNYHHFINTAGLINNYYGYNKIMEELPQLLQETFSTHPQASRFFLNYVILTRLKNYIGLYNFSRNLHLRERDPLNFTQKLNAILRLQLRMKTLSQQKLHENGPSTSTDKENFTRGYVAFSMKDMTLAGEQQPYIANSFNQFALVFPDKSEQDFVRQVSLYYDRNMKSGQATVSQEIYKYFIDAASLKIRQQYFVQALDFLANAAYFENNFSGVKRIPEFNNCLVRARDGLATSYLKVAQMASEKDDRQLEAGYMAKASRSLRYLSTRVTAPKKPVCYKNYFREALKMSKASFEQGHYRQTLSLLTIASLGCQNSTRIDSLRAVSCEMLLKKRLDVSQQLLEQGKITTSRDSLMNIVKDYSVICPFPVKLMQNSTITALSTAIFRQAIAKGAQLHENNQNTTAMAYLNLATQLQKTFLLAGSPRLDTLLAETTVPYILSVAGKANLEIWKKHFQKADSIYRLAHSLSRHFNVTENSKIKNTLATLSTKIKVAECQWRKEKIYQLFTQVKRSVKAYQMASAKSYFLKAGKLYAQTGFCMGDKQRTDSVFHAFNVLFRFTEAYHKLTMQLFSKGFAAVLPGFAMLETQYKNAHLQKFGIPFTGLYPFVRSQHSEKLTMEAVHYFIQNKKYGKALRYLQLSRNLADTKAEQKQLAEGFVTQNLVPGQDILNNPLWKTFAKTYRKVSAAKTK